MIGISITFTAGRYHATPWGKHVNEGVPEWPPSSWRLLRALVSSWKRTADHIPEEDVRGLLLKLSDPPHYFLPKASTGHTRHYMPWSKDWNKKRHAAKTLIFDTFVVVSKDEEVKIFWPDVDLTEEQKKILRELTENLPYFGRSEAWCRAEVFEENGIEIIDGVLVDEDGQVVSNCDPLDDASMLKEDRSVCKIMVPSKDNIPMDEPLDEGHPLLVRTSILRDELNKIDPPGAMWLEYSRQKDCFEPDFKSVGKVIRDPVPTIARYVLDGPALPPITEAIELTSLARAACMSIVNEDGMPLFSGKDEDGNSLSSGHQHAHYIVSDEDGDGKIDHLTIYAEMGFDENHVKALSRLSKLYGFKNRRDISTLLLGMVENGDDWPYPSEILGCSKTWVSGTPYLLTRHPKKTRSGSWKTEPLPVKIVVPKDLGRFPTDAHLLLEYGVTPDKNYMQKDGVIAQLLLSIERRGLPKPVSIEPLPSYSRGGVKRRWIEFKRYRRGGKKPSIGNPYGFRITFDEPIMGPMCLGHASHFGLGLFVVDRE